MAVQGNTYTIHAVIAWDESHHVIWGNERLTWDSRDTPLLPLHIAFWSEGSISSRLDTVTHIV